MRGSGPLPRNPVSSFLHIKVAVGDVWTWTAIDADTKLVPCWFLSESRDAGAAYEFMSDLEGRLAHRIQLTTDGHRAYLEAVDSTFGYLGIDYAVLIKLYGHISSVMRVQ